LGNHMTELDELIHLTAYRPAWPEDFAAEQERIVAMLSIPPDRVQHIGSTAVKGLIAKPVIDLMIGLTDYPPPDAICRGLARLAYEALGEAGVPGRRYFRLRGERSFNLHAVLAGGQHWQANLALRDYLRANASAQERYANCKRAALDAGANTLLSYSAAKAETLAALLREAISYQSGART
jgi:GrpB-like predicted nucleotidyltransferase (UPF0157 family)